MNITFLKDINNNYFVDAVIISKVSTEKEIQERALKTYEKSTKNNFFKKICCDFKTLEEKSKDYCKSKCE